MLLNLVKNDFKKNPGNNLVLLLFMTLSVGLVATVILTISQLFLSISTMYETALPPHFLQMHKGMLDQENIDEFNQAYPNITHWQTVEMINVYGDELRVEGQKEFTLSDCRLDISLVKQNLQYDVLLNENREFISLKKGEIGVPVILLEKNPIKIGDKIFLESNGIKREFIVASYIYDGQMNSTLCSSTRFLISDGDFYDLHGVVGETEYLLETYFDDPSMAVDYQSVYEEYIPTLPKNGQAVTYTIIFLLSAMTDIMTVMVVFVMSVLLTLIALFCMKYTILTAMEEEITEIGTMKAMGLSSKAIANLYLSKIRILMIFGVIFGYLLSLIAYQHTSEHMNRTFGIQPLSWTILFVGALGSVLVYLVTIQYCKGILKKLKNISIVDALVCGKGFAREKQIRNVLHKSSPIPTTFFMALHEVRTEVRRFSLIILVMALVSCIVIIPINIVNTMETEEFISYMGSDVHDVFIEIEQGKDIENRFENLEKLLQKKNNTNYQFFERIRMMAMDAEGKRKSIHIDSGQQAGQGLQYLLGNAPRNESEIALSKLESEYLGINFGDSLALYSENHEIMLYVCGIYQDVTSGGMTAKTMRDFEGVPPEQYRFMVDFIQQNNKQEIIESWRNQLGNGYTIEQMDEFITEILGGVLKQLKVTAWVSMGIGIGLIGLVISLFMKLRLAGAASQIAIQKALGVSVKNLRKQELYQILISASIGVICGTTVANVFGDYLMSILFSAMELGIVKIQFFIIPMISWVIIPLTLLAFAGCFCWLGTKSIKKLNVLYHLND